jgi:hypothetical protein
MSAMTNRLIAVVGVAVLAWAGTPVRADAGGARLYEMTENMRLTSGGKFLHRKATSELLGTADVGTPLCPADLVTALSPGAATCTVNATGSDNINLGTGLGDFSGRLTVVVQGDNNADSPELVVMKGGFKGKMDFSPAIIGIPLPDGTRMILPLGHVTGKLTIDGAQGAIPFTGTFRLPFVMNSLPVPDGKGGNLQIPCDKNFPCDAMAFGGAPTPLNPMDRYDLVGSTRPLYLLDDLQTVLPVESSEFGGGWATVRFEIAF